MRMAQATLLDGSQDIAKVEIAKSEFEKFCRDRDFERSSECRVFGPAPRFEEVFASGGIGRRFITILSLLGTDAHNKSSKAYEISW